MNSNSANEYFFDEKEKNAVIVRNTLLTLAKTVTENVQQKTLLR
jgi:hypothetical protein